MYVDFLHLFLVSVYGCFSSGLLHHDDTGKPNVNAVLDGLNDRYPVPKQMSRKLQPVTLALQKDNTSR